MLWGGEKDNASEKYWKGLSQGETRLFLAGCWMLVLWIVGIAFLWRLDNLFWLKTLTLGFTTLFLGRAVAVAQAIQSDMHPVLIVTLTTYVDMVTTMIAVPVLLWSYRNFIERPFLKRHVKSVFEAAEKGIDRFSHFKIIGVFLFVWFPFWGTGVVVGAVLGYLLGLRLWANMATVLLGTMVAIICWVYAYDRLFDWLGGIHEAIPLAATVGLLLVLVIIRIVVGARNRCL